MLERVKPFLFRLAVLLALAAGMGLLVHRGTPCLIRKYLGVICPACGMSRAWLAAFRLDFASAFAYHPMFWSVPALGLAYLLDGCPFPGRRGTNAIYLLSLTGLVLTYLVRIILYFNGICLI